MKKLFWFGLVFFSGVIVSLVFWSPEKESEPRYDTSDIVCAVITTEKYHRNRAAAVKNTWGSRCGLSLYFSATEDDYLPTIKLEGTEEGKIINEKVFKAFSYMYEHYGHSKKWFVKADDDTYIHFENLVGLLNTLNHSEPHYFGRAGEFQGINYCGGGAGYVLSQKALEDWYPHIPECPRLPVGEDVSVGNCLNKKVGLTPKWYTGFYHQIPDFFLNTVQGKKDHPEGLSPRPISFHSVQPEKMMELDYLMYYIRTEHNGKHFEKWNDQIWPLDPWPPSNPTH